MRASTLRSFIRPSSSLKLAMLAFLPTFVYNSAPSSLKAKIASILQRHSSPRFSDGTGECCGIIAYIGNKPLATKICTEGVKVLQFRGYDSCGLATLEGQEFKVSRFAIKQTPDCINTLFEEAPKAHKDAYLGIAHTRWATHGAKTQENAHPHFDAKMRVAVVHNGMLDNFKECLDELTKVYNVELRSQTDTELIAQYIGIFLDEGLSLEGAIQKTIKEKIHGTWALCIISKLEPSKIYLAKNAGTLVVGIHDDFLIASSDIAGFQEYTQKFVNVEDKKLTVFDFENRDKILEEEIKICPKEKIELDPRSGHKHFLIQEIYEQSDTLARATNNGARLTTPDNIPGGVLLGGLKLKEEHILGIDNLILSACGTSFYACQMSSHIFKKLECLNTIQVLDASEVVEEDFKIANAGMCAVSQSGETADLIEALGIAQEANITCFSIINKVESRIARDLRCGIYLNAGREVSVASTKAFPAQVMCLTMLAIWFTQNRMIKYLQQNPDKSPDSEEVKRMFKVDERIQLIKYLHDMPEMAHKVIMDSHKICKGIAELMDGHEHLFILGRGPCEAIAKEGALKIKEVSYIHAEGYIAGAFKHGPIAMINDLTSTRFILLIMKDDKNKLEKTLEQVKARNAYTIVISDCMKELNQKAIDLAIEIPHAGWLSPLLAVFPLQLLSYELAVRRGKNPDKPRHLAKEVTVK